MRFNDLIFKASLAKTAAIQNKKLQQIKNREGYVSYPVILLDC